MDNFFEELLESRHSTKERLKEVGDKWNYDNLSLKDYNNYFSRYLGSSIENFRDEVVKRKGSVKAANIMGGTRVLRDLAATESYAIRLTDDRNLETKEEDKRKNVNIIVGDILSKKTVDALPDDLDIVLCMPAGAWSFLPMSPDIFYYLGSKVVDKMAVGGKALIQLPLLSERWIKDYAKKAENTPGLSINYYGVDEAGIQIVMTIDKTTSSATLPGFKVD